jgi:hypothetical protein
MKILRQMFPGTACEHFWPKVCLHPDILEVLPLIIVQQNGNNGKPKNNFFTMKK